MWGASLPVVGLVAPGRAGRYESYYGGTSQGNYSRLVAEVHT